MLVNLNGEIAAMEDRIEALYMRRPTRRASWCRPPVSASPCPQASWAAGASNRFANLAGMRTLAAVSATCIAACWRRGESTKAAPASDPPVVEATEGSSGFVASSLMT